MWRAIFGALVALALGTGCGPDESIATLDSEPASPENPLERVELPDSVEIMCPPAEIDVIFESEAMCPARPSVINVTEWTEEELDENWTYSATDHMWPRLAGEPFAMSAPTESAAALEAWQGDARDAFVSTLRLDLAEWPDTPLSIRVLDSVQEDGYRRDRIDYLVEPGLRIPAYLLVPDGAESAPAIVYWHGHNYGGKDEPVAINGYTESNNYHHAAAARLAQDGYVVLAPDVRTFGETGNWDQHIHFTRVLNAHGYTALGVFVADAVKAVDVISNIPEVDSARIGTTGISLGGQIALFLTAVDSRIRASVVQGYFGSMRDTLFRTAVDDCQYASQLSYLMDVPDIALLAAPVPVLVAVGERDPFWLQEPVANAVEITRAGYELLGYGDRFDFATDDVPHEWIHEPALAWFDEWL